MWRAFTGIEYIKTWPPLFAWVSSLFLFQFLVCFCFAFSELCTGQVHSNTASWVHRVKQFQLLRANRWRHSRMYIVWACFLGFNSSLKLIIDGWLLMRMIFFLAETIDDKYVSWLYCCLVWSLIWIYILHIRISCNQSGWTILSDSWALLVIGQADLWAGTRTHDRQWKSRIYITGNHPQFRHKHGCIQYVRYLLLKCEPRRDLDGNSVFKWYNLFYSLYMHSSFLYKPALYKNFHQAGCQIQGSHSFSPYSLLALYFISIIRASWLAMWCFFFVVFFLFM